jgi:hypothetical protein
MSVILMSEAGKHNRARPLVEAIAAAAWQLAGQTDAAL